MTVQADGPVPVVERLRECPFCGHADDLLVIETKAAGERWWRAFCDYCCTDGPSNPTEAGAIAAWNHRAPSADLISELLEALEGLVVTCDHIGSSVYDWERLLPEDIERANAAIALARP